MTDRELDVLVAEKVMGELMPSPPSDQDGDLAIAGSGRFSPRGAWMVVSIYDEGDVPRWEPMPYSTDIAAAWKVVEKLGIWVCPSDNAHGWQAGWYYNTDPGDTAGSYGDTAPRAICLAALAARDPSFRKGGDGIAKKAGATKPAPRKTTQRRAAATQDAGDYATQRPAPKKGK